jgi:hypothetical protein
MVTRIIWVSAALFFFGVLFTACPLAECLEGNRVFDASQYRFSPPDSLLKVGDTLWLTSRFSCKALTNLVTKMPEDYCGASVGSSLSILSMLSISFKGAVDSFDFVSIKGRIFTHPKTILPKK